MKNLLSEPVVQHNSQITLQFEISLTNGVIVESNFNSKPAFLTLGSETLPAEFEKFLIGMRSGERKKYFLKQQKVFGDYLKQNIKTIDKSKFTDIPLENGVLVTFNFNNSEMVGTIVEIREQAVVVDFNHVLAEKSLYFDVKICSIESAKQANSAD